ncbi:MAG: hypothetical protein ABR529_07550, partial [Actinomycetota bacterium]
MRRRMTVLSLALLACAAAIFPATARKVATTTDTKRLVNGAPDAACQGLDVAAGVNLAQVVHSAPGGSTFCLSSGTYDVGTTTIMVPDGTSIIGQPVTVGASGSIEAPTKIVGNGTDLLQTRSNVTLANLDLGGDLSGGVVRDNGTGLTISY